MEIISEHQKKAISMMHPGCILVGGVGSGKTRTALKYYLDNFKDLKLYIITTAAKRNTNDWEKESEVFDIPFSFIEKVDSWNNIKKYTNISGAFFIFDEQHASGMGVWAKSFIQIGKKNKWITLSATPADSYMDLWAHLVANGYYKNKSEFIREHVVYNSHVKNFPMIDHYTNTSRLEYYRRKMYINMDLKRNTKRIYNNIICDFDMAMYKRVMKDRWNVFEERPIENAAELCYTLRRVINSDKSRIHNLYTLYLKHKKLIVYYSFDYELELIREMCDMFDIPYAELNGHKHEKIPDSDSWLYVVNYYHSEAWNCIETDTMVFYSQTYSYKTFEQSSGRIDRINTTYDILYYYCMRSNASLDIAIKRCLSNKKEFNERSFVKAL